MNKYLKMIGNILLYVAVAFGFIQITNVLAAKVLINYPITRGFVNNSLLYGFTICLLLFLVLALVFRLKGKSLMKTCNFARISFKNIGFITLLSLSMSLFTSSLCNILFARNLVPVMQEYVKSHMDNGGSAINVFLSLTIAVLLEEVVLRGIVFNELRANMHLVHALWIQAAIYGVLQLDLFIGVYAFVASILYALPYVWTRSLWASILVQVISTAGILFIRRTGITVPLNDYANGGLLLLGILGMVAAVIFMRRSIDKPHPQPFSQTC